MRISVAPLYKLFIVILKTSVHGWCKVRLECMPNSSWSPVESQKENEPMSF